MDSPQPSRTRHRSVITCRMATLVTPAAVAGQREGLWPASNHLSLERRSLEVLGGTEQAAWAFPPCLSCPPPCVGLCCAPPTRFSVAEARLERLQRVACCLVRRGCCLGCPAGARGGWASLAGVCCCLWLGSLWSGLVLASCCWGAGEGAFMVPGSTRESLACQRRPRRSPLAPNNPPMPSHPLQAAAPWRTCAPRCPRSKHGRTGSRLRPGAYQWRRPPTSLHAGRTSPSAG